jgi:hypothetical protein
MNRRKMAILIGTVAAILVVSTGVAIAGGALGSDAEKQAFLSDAAKRLDVTPAELQAALQGAFDARIDAAVAAGKITKEQGEAMKQRSKDGGLPHLGGRGHGGFGGPGHHGGSGHHGTSLGAAATYLGLTQAELRAELASGKTLAQIAEAQGKSVDGLKAKLKGEAKTKLDAAVKAGRITQAQADEMLGRLDDHLDAIVNGTARARGHHGSGWGGPPAAGTAPPASFVPVSPAGSVA